jgi:hypothetical protein
VDSPPVEIGNLEAGTTYYFSVYFIDGITHRSSNYSNEQSLVVSPTGTEIAATATPSPIETATPSFTPYTPPAAQAVWRQVQCWSAAFSFGLFSQQLFTFYPQLSRQPVITTTPAPFLWSTSFLVGP